MSSSIAILSVAFDSLPALRQLAGDLTRQTTAPSHWMVVNNAPDTAPLRPGDLPCPPTVPLEIVDGEEGDGFGAGCNRGFRELERHGWYGWIWLLNPDTRLHRGGELDQMEAALSRVSPSSVVGTAVHGDDGSMEASGGWWDGGLAFRRRCVGSALLTSTAPVELDWLSGCSLCLRPTTHHPSARFDPSFPLYYEDMDLCLRLKRQGAPILWLPRPGVVHHRGEGSRVGSARRLHLSTISYLRFLRRHGPGWVMVLRSLRLVLKNLLLLPLRPRRCLAALGAVPAGLGWRPSGPVEGPR